LDHLIPSLAALLETFRPCFRAEAFFVFHHAVAGWVLCLGGRTLTEVWQHAALSGSRHFSALFHLFADARWDLSDLGLRLALLLVDRFAPDGRIWLVVDDTLCHKRGADVAFGGIFLDAVLSSKRRKVFRFGVNQVVLGLAVRLPWRPDRCFCLPLLCEPFRKKGTPGHVKKTQLAAAMAARVAALLPGRDLCLVGDSAYVNAATLRDRPANLHALGPIHPKAALYAPPAPPAGKKGRPRLRGDRLPTPREMFEDTTKYEAKMGKYGFPGGQRELRTQEVCDVLWYTAAKTERLRLVLVRDPEGKWRDLALVCTDPEMTVAEAIEGYCRRWSIELTFHDCKQHLGLSEPQVRKQKSVERAHAMAYFCYGLTILWYAENGATAEPLARERPWYKQPKRPAFAEMLGMLRLALWQGRIFGGTGTLDERPASPDLLNSLLHHIAAVR
jgi:DDE superfamily endonuclease